jgi:Xaa-Pro aminopeptidase
MRMMNTALLVGPYDWDPALVPRSEFETRLSVVRRVLAERGATALLVHGHSVEHGALAYLTGFVPKLGPAFALVPLDGSIRILASGGPGMMSSAKLLTWVEDVRPFANLRNALSEWFNNLARDGRVILGLWGGKAMAQRPYVAIAAAIQPFGKIIEMDDPLDAVRRHKSVRELHLLRQSCRILATACDTFARALADGATARSAALAAERAAFALGAQDVRILASARNGGPPLPFDGPGDVRIAPLLACLAVRFVGYWSEGLITVGTGPNGALVRAEAALAAMLQEARPGVTSNNLVQAATKHLPPYKFHSLLESAIGNSIGLSLEESPILSHDENSRLEQGGVYTLRCGALGESSDNAVVSAMVAVNGTGIDVLWSTAEYSGNQKNVKGSR